MTPHWFRLFLLSAALLAGGAARAQSSGVAQLGAPASGRPALLHLANPTARLARVPLRVRRNLLLIPVMLNGRGPFQFVLDTGVETAILTDPAVRDSLHLPPGQPLLVEGAGEDAALRAEYHDSVRIELSGVAPGAIPLTVLSGDVLRLSQYVGEPVAGLIGFDVFRAFVVEIRPAADAVFLHAPGRFRAPRRAARLPLAVRGGKPYINSLIEQAAPADTLTARLLIDTGAGHALSLEMGAHPALRLPPQRLRSQLGRGLSGPINGWLGRAGALALGPYRLRLPLVSFPDSAAARAKVRVRREGTLGYEALRRFRVWFDYPGRGLWLRPGSGLRAPFEHDMSGCDLAARGTSLRRIVVVQVTPGSPAEVAGLLPDDELLAIDGRGTDTYSLTALDQLLRSRDGRPIPLLVRRTTELFYTTLVLRRAI